MGILRSRSSTPLPFVVSSWPSADVLPSSQCPVTRFLGVVKSCLRRIILAIGGVPASYAALQIASEIGAGQTVDKKVDAVVAEEDGSRDVDPSAVPVRLRRVNWQLEQSSVADRCSLHELDVVGTPGDEERNVEDDERGGDWRPLRTTRRTSQRPWSVKVAYEERQPITNCRNGKLL